MKIEQTPIGVRHLTGKAEKNNPNNRGWPLQYEPPSIIVHSAEKLRQSSMMVSACSPFAGKTFDQWQG